MKIYFIFFKILNFDNAIIDLSTQVRFQVMDPIKLSNTLQDLNGTLKSVARGYLVGIISKKDANKIEIEKSYIIQDFKVFLIQF